MRILQVVHSFPSIRRAGVELYTYYLSKELAEKHEVHILYPIFEKKSKKELWVRDKYEDGLYIHEIVFPTRFIDKLKRLINSMFIENTYLNSRIDPLFENLLDEINPDIVHFQHVIGLSASLIKISKQKNVPTVLTLHDYWFMCPTTNLLRWDYSLCNGPYPKRCQLCWSKKHSEALAESLAKFYIPIPKSLTLRPLEVTLRALNSPTKFEQRECYLKSLLLMADKIVTPSQFLMSIFTKYGVLSDKIIYSENGYNLEIFKGFRKKKKDTDKMIFGFAGSVTPIKGVHILIEAFLKVPEEKAELRIYGGYNSNSPYVRELFKKIQGKSNIHFLGKYEDPKVPFSEIDVLVFPSITYENCPLVLAEARATRTPVIASNLGAIPEFVENNRVGFLFKPNDPSDLHEKIMYLIENPNLITKFKKNIKLPKSISEQANEIERIYMSLVT
ncbi:glycosyltransferase family 4 protein [Thermococcus sp. 21S7]|uniref:glycosyltransferase n=1 Tax=Thermococcus sp. 21S7 TaxID=1638221 RepID=UPI001439C064|nr:glycosyltransferase [Thermococcus sp. 21S7]